jgi:signal transduction histidine kinase
LPKSLYAKLALTLIALLFVTAIVYSAISYSLTRQRIIGDLQRENAKLAGNLVTEIPQTLAGDIDRQYVEQLFHLMMIVNPDVELYLLDMDGTINSTSVDRRKLLIDKVSLQPLTEFLQSDSSNFPLFAQDPRAPGKPVTFSVAKLKAGEKELGYLYVTLRGEDHQRYQSGRATDLISTIGIYALIGSLLVSLLAGLTIFKRITSRLQILSGVIDNFRKSGYRQNVLYRDAANDTGADEISKLGGNYDSMAQRITEQIELLEQQDHNRRKFIANISHDLRTPLTATQGYLELLQQKYDTLEEDERKRYLSISLKHSKRLQNLISNLFELAKLENYSELPASELLSLSDIISDVMQGYQPLAQNKSIDLRYEQDQGSHLVKGDLAMIDRAISNLLSNALQYTQEGGWVVLKLSKRANESGESLIEFSIEDNGPGIDEAQLGNIFDRFYRADNQHAGEKNAGLGLAIAQRIVALHGGELGVKNTGNGTRFCFSLNETLAG